MKASRPASPLPTRDGVSPSCVVVPAGYWPSLMAFMCERFPAVSPEDWLARIAAGEVVDDAGRALSPHQSCKQGLRLYYYRALAFEAPVPFEERVLFQDDLLVVADKPHFLPVTPGGRYVQESLLVRLKRKLGIETLSPVHRIDRETAGLVVFAVQPRTRGAYQALFAERAVAKTYEAVVSQPPGWVSPEVYRSRVVAVDDDRFMQMREVPGEPNAETRIGLIEQGEGLARYRLNPVSGRRHQLRLHCMALGMPILFDRIYPHLLPENTDEHARPLQLLARQIAFRDPLSGEARCFDSQLALMELQALAVLRQSPR